MKIKSEARPFQVHIIESSLAPVTGHPAARSPDRPVSPLHPTPSAAHRDAPLMVSAGNNHSQARPEELRKNHLFSFQRYCRRSSS